MADKWPLASGNWSNAANWNSGTKPVTGDVVYFDGKTIAIDEAPATGITLRNSQRSGGTGYGAATIGISVDINANMEFIVGSPNQMIVDISGAVNVNIVGNISLSLSLASDGVYCIRWGSSGTLNITGVLSANSNRSSGGCLHVNGSGTVNIIGSVTNLNSGSTIYCATSATVNITGNCTTASGAGSCVTFGASPNLNITGNVTAAGGVVISATSWSPQVVVTGNVISINETAIQITQISALVYVYGNIENSVTAMAICARRLRISSSTNSWKFFTVTGAARILYSAETIPGQPVASNVREGIIYGPAGEVTGTLAVPPASAVASGTPVDNTVGTAVLTEQNVADAVAPLLAAFGS